MIENIIEITTSVLALLVTLGILVTVHEFGHFWVARRCGVKVLKFSIGFGKAVKTWVGKDGVEYVIAPIPLGGYVRMLGQEDTSLPDAEAVPAEDRSKSFAAKSVWQRMAISAAGPAANFLLAIVIFWIINIAYGTSGVAPIISSVVEGSVAERAGLESGDEILAVDGSPVEDFMDIQSRIVTGKLKSAQDRRLSRLTILRNGEQKEIEVFPEVFGNEEFRIIGIGPKETFFIKELQPDMPAIKAGLEKGDQLVSVDGNKIFSFYQLVDYLMKLEDGKEVALTVRKGGESGLEQTYNLLPEVKELEKGDPSTKRKLIGFSPEFKSITTYPNPLVLIVSRVKDMYHTLTGLVNPQSDVKLRNMSEPVGIVNNLSIFASIGFKKLLWFVVFINVNLAILNLLPIPVLDGGHMAFATIEKIRGKPLPRALLERSQILFIVLLFSFMLYVTFFDFQRLF
jgi:regulator of sigma E protease